MQVEELSAITYFALAVGLAGWLAWTSYIFWSIPSAFRLLLDFNAIGEGWIEAVVFPALMIFSGYALVTELRKG